MVPWFFAFVQAWSRRHACEVGLLVAFASTRPVLNFPGEPAMRRHTYLVTLANLLCVKSVKSVKT